MRWAKIEVDTQTVLGAFVAALPRALRLRDQGAKSETGFGVRKKRCGQPSCTKTALFGVAGTRKAEFCAQHAEAGMVRMRSSSSGMYAHAGCTKHPS